MEGKGQDGRVLFEAQGFQYAIEHRDGRVIHKETRSDAGGRIIAQNEAEVRFVLGSGRQGVAYLIERDGFLFESPITWYPQKRRWDLSPGYETTNSHFDRPILPGCLFCHANRVEPAAGTVNRYQPPVFRGHAIGCERCHGPGELHVARPTVVNDREPTIVNPASLEPALRDAVCEQCHLIGQQRILRAGRHDQDYRPGLPFYRFWSALEPVGGPAEDRFVGQVEQMHESRCFRASRGQLGCVSCHDPHQLPEGEAKAAYYRNRCLDCHSDRGCSLPTPVRLARSREDDCAGCHMPRLNRSEILHVATTNHRIPRQADAPGRPPIPAASAGHGQLPLVNFHLGLLDDRERAEARRDIGVALCREGADGAAVALPLLEAALAVQPDDIPAWESKGFALGQLDRTAEGLAAFRTALAKDPNHESAWVGASYLAAQAGRRDDAITAWQRAIAISPWRSDYRAELAAVYFRDGDWNRATEACLETLRLNPANVEIRKLLVQCDLRRGNAKSARDQLETLVGFNPLDRDALLRWFASQPRPGSRPP
jgi:Tfp pilus assembly protein PilF